MGVLLMDQWHFVDENEHKYYFIHIIFNYKQSNNNSNECTKIPHEKLNEVLIDKKRKRKETKEKN